MEWIIKKKHERPEERMKRKMRDQKRDEVFPLPKSMSE